MNLFGVPEAQRFFGLLLGVLHHGLGNIAKQSIPAKTDTVVQTGDKFFEYIRDGKVPHQ